MLDDELMVMKAPNTPKLDERLDWAKGEWEKSERAFRQSVGVLCGIIEGESRIFPDGKMAGIDGDFKVCLVSHRTSNRKDFAQALQDFVNKKHEEIVADWWRELGNPAAAYVGDSILRFNTRTNEIIRCVTGMPTIPPEPEIGQTEESLAQTEVGPGQEHRVRAGWFRRRMLRYAAQQLRTDVEVSVDVLCRRLVKRIQCRAANVRQSLHRQLDQALADVTEFSVRNIRQRESEYPENASLSLAIELPASKSTVSFPLEPAVDQIGILCHGTLLADRVSALT